MEENKSSVEISLRDLWKIFLRCWWVMLAAAIVFAGASYLFLRVTHKDVYTARARIWVMRETAGQTAQQDVTISNNLIKDVLLISETDRVLDAVIAETGTGLSKNELKKNLALTNETNTHVVELKVTVSAPAEAQALANSLAHNICDTMNNYLFDSENYTKMLDEAVLPEKPSNPISKLAVLLAAFIGALAAYIVFFVLYLLDDKINTADDVKKYLEISVLGDIPNRRDVYRHQRKYGGYYSNYQSGAGEQEGDAK